MIRRLSSTVLALLLVATSCAGPSKLAERSEKQLASGDIWKAWHTAMRALEREPLNPRAKNAAAAAGGVIADDWQRRIRALAQGDSMRAAEQVLEFAAFRTDAAVHVTIDVSPAWDNEERSLRRAAANEHYAQGKKALAAQRPKAAFHRFRESARFIATYRDAETLADRAYQQALTRVAVMAFASPGRAESFGREVGDRWRDALAAAMVPPDARFTRMLGSDAVDRHMTVAQSMRMSRDDSWRLGRKSGADRIVWGSIGPVTSETHLQIFHETVARRIVQRNLEGQEVVRWVDVPIEVVARVRDVQVDIDYEIISTRDGASLAHARLPRATQARVVWTSYSPEGDPNSYALISEAQRAADPERARVIEQKWKTVCGGATTLAQVLAERRNQKVDAGYRREVLGRFMTGAAFVFLQELPPAEDLALATAMDGWGPLRDDLARLDGIDEVDLGVHLSSDER